MTETNWRRIGVRRDLVTKLEIESDRLGYKRHELANRIIEEWFANKETISGEGDRLSGPPPSRPIEDEGRADGHAASPVDPSNPPQIVASPIGDSEAEPPFGRSAEEHREEALAEWRATVGNGGTA